MYKIINAIKIWSITKQFIKTKYCGVEFNYKKKSRNKSYTSRTTQQELNTHSNDKLQQRHPKVPKGPNQVKKSGMHKRIF